MTFLSRSTPSRPHPLSPPAPASNSHEQAVNALEFKAPEFNQQGVSRQQLNEQQWETQLSLPSEQQWRRMIAKVRQDIATGRITPLHQVLC
ncbi:MAG: hypothetical protein ACPGVO_15360 [Spirulinaceae cyanobacterium]